MSTIPFIGMHQETSEAHIQAWLDAQRWPTLHPNQFKQMFEKRHRSGAEFYLRPDKAEQERLKAAFDTVLPTFMEVMRGSSDETFLAICNFLLAQTPQDNNPSLRGTKEQQEANQYLARIYAGLYRERQQEIEMVPALADAVATKFFGIESKI